MSLIASLRKSNYSVKEMGITRSPTDRGLGRDLWRQVFGAPTTKEDGFSSNRNLERQVVGNGMGQSLTGTKASVEKLIQALRSRAPGGWSDDRWEQTMRHYLGITYMAIFRKAIIMQQSEFQVFKRDRDHPDGKVPVKFGDPGYDLVQLLERPNKQDSFGKWMFRVTQQKELTGSALTWILPNMIRNQHPDPIYEGCGTPFQMYCTPTAMAIPQPVVNPTYPDGYWRIQPVYPYGPFSSFPVPNSAVGAPIGGQWMMKFQYPHPLLRYDGYSPLTGMREHIDGLQAIDRSRWYKMKKTLRPNGVLNMEGVEGSEGLPWQEIERIRAEIEAAFMGPENVGNLFVTYPGARLEEWGQAPAEMDYGNGWDQLTSFILASFGITKPVVGMVDDQAYSVLFASLKQVHTQTTQPECDDIGAEITHFLAPFFGPDIIVEVRCKRIDDHEIKHVETDQMVSAKCITKNEVRKRNDMPVTDQPWGDDIAGDPSPAELEMQQQQQQAMMQPQPGMEEGGVEEQPQTPNDLIGDMVLEGVPPEEGNEEIEQSRPRPGKLGEGSLGPRKSLEHRTKSLLENKPPKKSKRSYRNKFLFDSLVRKAYLNGDATPRKNR